MLQENLMFQMCSRLRVCVCVCLCIFHTCMYLCACRNHANNYITPIYIANMKVCVHITLRVHVHLCLTICSDVCMHAYITAKQHHNYFLRLFTYYIGRYIYRGTKKISFFQRLYTANVQRFRRNVPFRKSVIIHFSRSLTQYNGNVLAAGVFFVCLRRDGTVQVFFVGTYLDTVSPIKCSLVVNESDKLLKEQVTASKLQNSKQHFFFKLDSKPIF